MFKHTQTIRRQKPNCLSVFDYFVSFLVFSEDIKWEHYLQTH